MRDLNRTAVSDVWRGSPRAGLAFSGAGEIPFLQADDGDSDFEESRLLGRIARDGLLRTDTLDSDWE